MLDFKKWSNIKPVKFLNCYNGLIQKNLTAPQAELLIFERGFEETLY
jgi:hypothetical protein